MSIRGAERAGEIVIAAPAAVPNVRSYLAAVARFRAGSEREGWRYPCLEALVLDRGKVFTPHPYPASLPAGPPKQCYVNALRLVGTTKVRLRYVEGFAFSRRSDLVTMHGWCVNDRGWVYDPTWERPEENEYLGLVVPLGQVRLSTSLPVLEWGAGRYLRNGWEPEA